MEQEDLIRLASQFQTEDDIIRVEPLGNGLINTTYRACTADGKPDYVLQEVNLSIFPDPDVLMGNILAVTQHLRRKLEEAGAQDIDRHVLTFLPAQDGRYYLMDEGHCWRLMKFIPDTLSQTGVTPESAYIVGKTFGDFQSQLSDLSTPLGDTIKDFHNMEFRLFQLREAVKANKSGRLAQVQSLVDAIEARAEEMCKAERLFRAGQLPKRICHCDTKVDNILFDKDGSVLCVIDLDTVMPNFIFSDYGDYLRSAANTGREDDPVLENVQFNMDIFRSFTRGYLETARRFLTPVEIEHLPYAAKLFPYMQTVRFLADYIDGDLYYRVLSPDHNLVRSRAQWKLFESADQHEQEMQEFIHSL